MHHVAVVLHLRVRVRFNDRIRVEAKAKAKAKAMHEEAVMLHLGLLHDGKPSIDEIICRAWMLFPARIDSACG